MSRKSSPVNLRMGNWHSLEFASKMSRGFCHESLKKRKSLLFSDKGHGSFLLPHFSCQINFPSILAFEQKHFYFFKFK